MSEATPAKKKAPRKSAKKAAPAPKVETPEVAEAPNVDVEPVSLTIQDLTALSTIVDAACQRGAFKGAEMETVGKTYNKLLTFLEQVNKQQEEAAEVEGETEAPAE